MRLQGARVVLTGGTGTLGSELKPLLEERGSFVIAPTRGEMDINNGHSVSKFFAEGRGRGCDMLIHCAAYTDVPNAQLPANHRKVINTNILGTGYLSSWAKQNHFKMVYISTDYVYEGTKGDALTKVFTDVYTSKDWVDIIAGKIIDKLGDTGVYNVGTERKSLKDLAVQEYPEVEDLDLNILDFGFNYPKDSSMRVDT